MKLCNLAKFVYPVCLDENNVNYQTLRGWSQFANRAHFIVLSPDKYFRRVTYFDRIDLIQLPRLNNPFLNHIHFVIRAILWGLRISRKEGVDIFDGSHPSDGGIAAVVLKWLTGKKAVVEVQGELFNLSEEHLSSIRVKAHYWLTWVACRLSDRVRCVSEHTRGQVEQAGICPEKIRVVYARCNESHFDPEKYQVDRQEIRTRLGFENVHMVGVFTGRFNVHKGIEYLLRALPEILNVHEEFRLLLVGDGPLLEDYRKQASVLGVKHAVKYYGRATYNEIPGLLSAGNLFILPSIDEGMPRSLLEAMAMRLPVIASRTGGVPEAVEDGVSGVLVPPRDSKALAKAVVGLLDTPEDLERMGSSARERVAKYFSFEAGMQKFSKFFSELLE